MLAGELPVRPLHTPNSYTSVTYFSMRHFDLEMVSSSLANISAAMRDSCQPVHMLSGLETHDASYPMAFRGR